MFKTIGLLLFCVVCSFSHLLKYIHSLDNVFLEKVSKKEFKGLSEKYQFFSRKGIIFKDIDSSRVSMRLFWVFSPDFAIYRFRKGYIGFMIRDNALYRTKISKMWFSLDLGDLVFVNFSNSKK